MTIWIKGGEVVDPVKGTVEKLDVIVERGRVSRLLPHGKFKEKGPKLRHMDASGKFVVPGFIDMHVHLREPGHEYKETIATGGKAGVAGGFTGLACMPNTEPINDSSSVTEFILRHHVSGLECVRNGGVTESLLLRGGGLPARLHHASWIDQGDIDHHDDNR